MARGQGARERSSDSVRGGWTPTRAGWADGRRPTTVPTLTSNSHPFCVQAACGAHRCFHSSINDTGTNGRRNPASVPVVRELIYRQPPGTARACEEARGPSCPQKDLPPSAGPRKAVQRAVQPVPAGASRGLGHRRLLQGPRGTTARRRFGYFKSRTLGLCQTSLCSKI